MGTDNLTYTPGSGADNLSASSGSGADQLTKSAGTAADNLAKSAGTQFDGVTKRVFTLVTANGSIDDDPPVTISVQDASEFPNSGTAKIYIKAPGEEFEVVEYEITYTGKTATSLTGCTSVSSFNFIAGDRIEI